MLDVAFHKGTRFSFRSSLDFCLFTKPSSIWKPLSPESMHAAFVHQHWPAAQCSRIQRRFSSSSEGTKAVSEFKSKLFNISGVAVGSMTKELKPFCCTSWLVLPFDFALVKSGVASAVSSVVVPNIVKHTIGKIRVSWALGNKRLMHLLRQRPHERGMEG